MENVNEQTYIEGKYYFGKGYFWKGKFITSNSGQDAYELGYYHGKCMCENLSTAKLKKVLKCRPANDYEKGKIDAIKDYLKR